MNYIKIIF